MRHGHHGRGIHHGGHRHHHGIHHHGMHHGMHHHGMHHGVHRHRAGRRAVGGGVMMTNMSAFGLAGVNLYGKDQRSCLPNHFNLDYISSSQRQEYETGLLAKEFRDQKVFIRFPVDDVERAWSCLKSPKNWLSTFPGSCVLASGVDGTQGAKYNSQNDVFEITQLSDGRREIEIKISMFEKEQERLVKGKIIENDERANGKDVVELEFDQLKEEHVEFQGGGDQGCKVLLYIPCFWPHLIILTALLLIIALFLTIPHTFNALTGKTKKPAGKFLTHPDALQLRAKFQTFGLMKQAQPIDGLVPTIATPVIPDALDIEKGIAVDDSLGMTTSVLPPGFGS